jgi:hypothetical protein
MGYTWDTDFCCNDSSVESFSNEAATIRSMYRGRDGAVSRLHERLHTLHQAVVAGKETRDFARRDTMEMSTG